MPSPRADRRHAVRATIAIFAATVALTHMEAAEADALAGRQLESLMERIGRASERRASFHDEKTIGALKQPLTSTGYLLYRRPSYFEKVTTSPRHERIVVDGANVTIQAGDRPPQVITLASQPGLEALMDTFRGALSGNLAMLRRAYAIDANAEGSAWRLTLSPLDGALRRFVRGVVIEGSGSTPRVIDISQPNGDRERLTLTAR